MIRQIGSTIRNRINNPLRKTLASSRLLNCKSLNNRTTIVSFGSQFQPLVLQQRFYSEVQQQLKNESTIDVDSWRKQNDMTIIGDGCPDPIFTFEQANFPKHVLETFKSLKYQKPTVIQSQGWPLAMSGKDMIASAQTGSGKTVAFILPALEHIRKSGTKFIPKVLILAPTRELALQIESDANKFCRGYQLKTACLHGGQGNRSHQLKQLFDRPEVIIATPGRLLDFVDAQAVSLKDIDFVVLDEADRMLDMGFEDDVRTIIGLTNPSRQMLLWSATWPKKVQALASSFLRNPLRIKIGSDEYSANKNVKQEFIFCERSNKMDHIQKIIKEHQVIETRKKVLIFTDTKMQADIVHHNLRLSGINCAVIHGDKSQSARNTALDSFRRGKIQILVATDVAARGLDISNVNLVINFSMPNNIEHYIHRIGRTGRAGKKGLSISLFVKGMDDNIAEELIKTLKDAEQEVPKEIEMIALTNRNTAKPTQSRQNNRRGGGFQNRGSFGSRFDDSFDRGSYGRFDRGNYDRKDNDRGLNHRYGGGSRDNNFSDSRRQPSRGNLYEDTSFDYRRNSNRKNESAWDFDF